VDASAELWMGVWLPSWGRIIVDGHILLPPCKRIIIVDRRVSLLDWQVTMQPWGRIVDGEDTLPPWGRVKHVSPLVVCTPEQICDASGEAEGSHNFALMSNTPELNRTDCRHRWLVSAEVRSRNLLRLTGSRILAGVWEEERPWERGWPEVS